jgi:hypothetical protein
MGAWGVSTFENDDAGDWADELQESDDLGPVESALQAVEDADGYLEAPDASIALAACEVLARLKGRPGEKNAYSEPVDAWVAGHTITPSPELLNRAEAAIGRILSEDSELLDLWRDSEHHDAWLASVEDLRSRLRG